MRACARRSSTSSRTGAGCSSPRSGARIAEALDIKFHACPLKEAWQAAGLPEERIATLCRIAGVVDNGTFEAAGFAFSAETWQPGEDGCCFLHVRPGKPRPAS